ncbi:ribonuclease 8-like [Dama dama]|uniref:ribonuclease 8-like n=1 Tax=Dama dama TaxID=30532 RepID=UPI002A36BB70|nr:ribonuclease 8-like [Dama dama]
MAPARAGFCPLLLLLLLGLWVAEDPVSARPGNMTPVQWFETQHVQPRPQGCNTAIPKINKFSKHCKDLSTFLHKSIYCVVTTCQIPNIACKNGHKNCHQSQKPISLTVCELLSGRCPDCRYKEKQLDAFFIVACDLPQQKDDLRWVILHSGGTVKGEQGFPEAAAVVADEFS